MNEKHPFQAWLDKKGAVDLLFYPSNPSGSSATQIMDDAYKAVQAYEAGVCVPYEHDATSGFDVALG